MSYISQVFGGLLRSRSFRTLLPQNLLLNKYQGLTLEMAEKLEDLNLPLTVVTRIVKEALPEGVSISKEARTGLAKAASVFVLYVTSAATNIVEKKKKKALTGQIVLDAMKDIEFDRFIEPLTQSLEQYKQVMSARKSGGKKKDDDEPEVIEDD